MLLQSADVSQDEYASDRSWKSVVYLCVFSFLFCAFLIFYDLDLCLGISHCFSL